MFLLRTSGGTQKSVGSLRGKKSVQECEQESCFETIGRSLSVSNKNFVELYSTRTRTRTSWDNESRLLSAQQKTCIFFEKLTMILNALQMLNTVIVFVIRLNITNFSICQARQFLLQKNRFLLLDQHCMIKCLLHNNKNTTFSPTIILIFTQEDKQY